MATDLRDYVYGLLALTMDGLQLVGRPRYDEPVENLYTRLTIALVSSRKRLNFLCFKIPKNDKRGEWRRSSGGVFLLHNLDVPSCVLDMSDGCLYQEPEMESTFDVPLVWPPLDSILGKPVVFQHSEDGHKCIMKISRLRLDVHGRWVWGICIRCWGEAVVQPDSKNGYASDQDIQMKFSSAFAT